MSTLRSAFVTLLVLVIAVALAIFAVENLGSVSATFVGTHFTSPLWWVAIGSAMLGFIMAALLTLPGRVSTGWRARSLAREHQRKDGTIEELRDEHEQLRAENISLQTERDQLRSRLDDYMGSTHEPPVRSGYPTTYDDGTALEGERFGRLPRSGDESLPYREESSAAPPRR